MSVLADIGKAGRLTGISHHHLGRGFIGVLMPEAMEGVCQSRLMVLKLWVCTVERVLIRWPS